MDKLSLPSPIGGSHPAQFRSDQTSEVADGTQGVLLLSRLTVCRLSSQRKLFCIVAQGTNTNPGFTREGELTSPG